MRVDRSFAIDLCRGMLFTLMINSHALAVAGVPRSHWLYAGWWLPNGWATVVFVVLSGYGVGYIYSVRANVTERTGAMVRRSGVILAVMFGSNALFAMLRQYSIGDIAPIRTAHWWLGFLTLETEWTISGVLLPTGLVLLCGPVMIRQSHRTPWLVIVALCITRVLVSVYSYELTASGHAMTWLENFFLREGFGGFPVLPFVLNGCIGIWLGIQKHRSEVVWRRAMAVLFLVQLGIFILNLLPDPPYCKVLIESAGAVGKFAWMLLIASVLTARTPMLLNMPIALIGKYALASFVMHRIFLQVLGISIAFLGLNGLQAELRFALLLGGAFTCTWILCVARRRYGYLEALLGRVGL